MPTKFYSFSFPEVYDGFEEVYDKMISDFFTPKYYKESNNNLRVKDLEIKDVKFNDPATIVWFNDGSKTVVKCQNDETFDKEKGLAMAIVKRLYDNKGSFNEVFKKYC